MLILIRIHRRKIEIEYICGVFESYNLTPLENVERYRSITNSQPKPTAPPQSPVRRSPRRSTVFRTPNQSPIIKPRKSPIIKPRKSPSRPHESPSRPQKNPRKHEKKNPTKTHEKKKNPKKPTKTPANEKMKNIAQYKMEEYGRDAHLIIKGQKIQQIKDQNYQKNGHLVSPELVEWHLNISKKEQLVNLICKDPYGYGYCQMNSEFLEKCSCANKYFSKLDDDTLPLVLYRWHKETWVQTGN